VEPSRLLVVVPDEPDGLDLVPPVPGRHAHPENAPLDVLRRLYPAEHPVAVASAPESASALRTVGELTDAELGRGVAIPPLPVELAFGGLWTMAGISA